MKPNLISAVYNSVREHIHTNTIIKLQCLRKLTIRYKNSNMFRPDAAATRTILAKQEQLRQCASICSLNSDCTPWLATVLLTTHSYWHSSPSVSDQCWQWNSYAIAIKHPFIFRAVTTRSPTFSSFALYCEGRHSVLANDWNTCTDKYSESAGYSRYLDKHVEERSEEDAWQTDRHTKKVNSLPVSPKTRINSMEQRPSWEANSFSASQEIPRILCNPEVH
jgi:hypothetical protein